MWVKLCCVNTAIGEHYFFNVYYEDYMQVMLNWTKFFMWIQVTFMQIDTLPSSLINSNVNLK